MANMSRHWVHGVFGPASSGAIGTRIGVDLFAGWRAAFGTPFQKMTAVRLLVTVDYAIVSSVTDGTVAWGILKGTIVGGTPDANPITSGVDDFTDWLLWDSGPQLAQASNTDQIVHRTYDLRSMRKFDPSRESLFFLFSTVLGESGAVDLWAGWRVLCLDA